MIPSLAVDIKESDFEWTEPDAEKPKPEVPIQPPKMISAEELEVNIARYVDELTSRPNWQEELLRRQAEKKAAKQRAREERLAARRQRKAA